MLLGSLFIKAFLICLLFSGKIFGAVLYDRYFSTRALGMGGAYVSVVDDSDAIFFNPGGLAFNSSFSWRVLEVGGGLNGQSALDTAEEVSGASGIEALNGLFGKDIWVGGGGNTTFYFPYMSIAAFDSGYVGVNVSNPPYPEFTGDFINDYGVAIAGALPLSSNLGLGITARRIVRQGRRGPISLGKIADEDSSELTKEYQNEGTGIGLDIGLMYEGKSSLRPRLGLVWQDVGDTTFKITRGTEAPPKILSNLVLGGSLEVDWVFVSFIPSLDIRYVDDHTIDLGRKIHMGLEVDFPILTLRGGFGQGYYSWGGSLDLWFIRLDVANYASELGEYPGQKEGRRWVASLLLELSFDPSGFEFLNFQSNKSSRRKGLKQRR